MLSCMGLCTDSSFLKLLIVRCLTPAHKHVACSFELHKLHLFSIVCVSILCFSLALLYILQAAKQDFKIEFLYSVFLFPPVFLPVFLSLASSLFFPDDSRPSMKSISHLGTG